MNRRNLQALAALFLWPALWLFYPLLQHGWLRWQGEAHALPTTIVDPRDVLRGHYLRLRFVDERLPVAECGAEGGAAPVYVRLQKQADGSSRVVAVEALPPARGAYLRLNHARCYDDGNGLAWHLSFPFQRHYSNEYTAPELEKRLDKARLRLWLGRGSWALGDLEFEELE